MGQKGCAIGLIIMACMVWTRFPGVGEAAEADREWRVTEPRPMDAPLQDAMFMYVTGGTDGQVHLVGVPSLKVYRHRTVGVDLKELVFSGKNGAPDGTYLFVGD
ncbi:MAG: hypothetical protein ACE5JL_09330, partial [Dehalococcoidia bacterium]